MLFRSKTKSPQREVFAEVFAATGLHAACRRSRTVKQRVLAVAGRWCPVWGEDGEGIFQRFLRLERGILVFDGKCDKNMGIKHRIQISR